MNTHKIAELAEQIRDLVPDHDEMTIMILDCPLVFGRLSSEEVDQIINAFAQRFQGILSSAELILEYYKIEEAKIKEKLAQFQEDHS